MSVSVEPREGLVLGGHLRLLRPLAQGGMASLWVAIHLGLGIEVVVKIPGPKADADTTGRQRFRREARLTGRVSSLHVVRILDVEACAAAEEDSPFLVMELLRGEDLSTRLTRRERLSLGETAMIVEHVALALEKAHAMGIVHRDVKPSNVFLVDGPGGVVAKLVDFGIAKDATECNVELTHAGSLMGTPPYMSPEQVIGALDVDWRCDLWSLAVVAYSCLTGRLPFDGDTFGAVCVAIHTGRFDLPSLVRPEVPARVDAFFRRALCRTLELRYRGARELSDAFRAATWPDEGEPTDAVGTGSPGRANAASAWATTRLELDLSEGAMAPETPGQNLPFDLGRPKSGVRVTARNLGRRGRAERGRA
jgi:serine/threonine-protein kinase